MNSFFAENYDHENVISNTLVNEGLVSSCALKRRKSVSSRFRSVSKDTPATDTSTTSIDTPQTDSSLTPSTQTTTRHSKYVRSQSSATTSSETKITPTRAYLKRDTRTLRTRSEDRYRGPCFSLLDSTGDTTGTSSSSSNSQLPSYAAHTSSSMNKLRDSSTSSITHSSAALLSSSSNTSLAVSSSRTRGVSSVVSYDTRSSSAKPMTKSRSSQNLIDDMAVTIAVNTEPPKPLPTRRTKVAFVSRRPPNLPTPVHVQLSTTSSSSSNASSPTKPKQHLSSVLQETVLPLPALDTSSNDLMPKWAQDCFYRTVVLGLKPLLLQDIPSSSPKKHSTSTSSVESSDSLDITNELINNLNELPIRRSLSVSDNPPQTDTTKSKQTESNPNDHRMPTISHLVDDLHKRLNELENFYSTVSHSSDKRDLMLKQTIEQIFTDLHTRISNDHQQQNLTSNAVND